MPYTVHIRKNETGEVKPYVYAGPDWNEETHEFMWSEGNYACDCNRSLFFGDDNPHKCSHDLYTITSIILSDGTVVYSEL